MEIIVYDVFVAFIHTRRTLLLLLLSAAAYLYGRVLLSAAKFGLGSFVLFLYFFHLIHVQYHSATVSTTERHQL